MNKYLTVAKYHSFARSRIFYASDPAKLALKAARDFMGQVIDVERYDQLNIESQLAKPPVSFDQRPEEYNIRVDISQLHELGESDHCEYLFTEQFRLLSKY